MKKFILVSTLLVSFILFLILNPIVIISAGQMGVITRMGAVQDEILNEGIHWVTPVIKNVIKFNVKTQKVEKESSAASKDLQIVTSNIALNYHLEPNKINKLYQEIGKNYEEVVIIPAIEEFVKKTTAKYTAEELITKRSEVKDDLKNSLGENLSKRHIYIDDVFITNFQFSESFDVAIEAKVTAEQKALEAKNKLEQVKFEAEQRITQATAEAESIRIQAQAITQQGGKDYVNLKWIEAWGNGGAKVPTYLTGDSGSFLFNLNSN